METVVMTVTMLARMTTARPSRMPVWPTTQVSRRNSITPQMFRRHRRYTPCKQFRCINTCLHMQYVSQGPTSNQPNLTAVFSTAIASLVSGSAWEFRLQLEELDGRLDSASWGCSEPWVGSLNFYINTVMKTLYSENLKPKSLRIHY